MRNVRVFVDFWNFTLTINRLTGMGFQTDWRELPLVLTRGAMHIISPGEDWVFKGMNVYGSYDPNSPKDQDMYRWATQTVARFPGVQTYFAPRQVMRSGPSCPSCHHNIETCPQCGDSMLGTEEKSVDVHMATDMVRLAWEGNYEVAILVTSDNDFLPVVDFLQTKGYTIVHGAFPPQGAELSQRCWASIDIPRFKEEFRR